jgi:hypothetical protein
VADLFLRRTLTGFAPADADAAEIARSFKVGQVYRAKVTKPRSYQHHKLIMALLWPSFDTFRKAIALEAGHTETVITRDGTIHEGPGSLSYDALDEVEFTRVSAAMMTICAQILEVETPELAGEVSRYADDRYGRAA